jgi:hypothetical protein
VITWLESRPILVYMSEYQSVRSSLKEQSDSIRLDQLTHFAQYILRQRILLSYFFFRLNTTLDLTPLCLACNPDLTTLISRQIRL